MFSPGEELLTGCGYRESCVIYKLRRQGDGMQTTYQIGSLSGLAAGDESAKTPSTKQVRDYREVFNPKDTGQPVDRSLHSEPTQQGPDYLEIARLVRPKKPAA